MIGSFEKYPLDDISNTSDYSVVYIDYDIFITR